MAETLFDIGIKLTLYVTVPIVLICGIIILIRRV